MDAKNIKKDQESQEDNTAEQETKKVMEDQHIDAKAALRITLTQEQLKELADMIIQRLNEEDTDG